MKFYNEITKEIYLSAYQYKQSQFIGYLNGQRQFRWEVQQKINTFQSATGSYEAGLIPKENISFHKYLSLPENIILKNVSLCSRAHQHV